jgi:signal peptidase I
LSSQFPEEIIEAPLEEPAEEKSNAFWRFLLDLLETLVLSVLLYLAINAVSARVRVDGFSMRPTLEDGQYVLVNRLAYRFGEAQRGDIVVFHSPVAATQLDLIKRVVGLPGETVNIRNGVVSVDNETLTEPYIADSPRYNGEWVVPEGHLFVLGDNRNDSSDSHSWGLLPTANVIGKAILIYWPPPAWELIDHVPPVAAAP